MPLPGHAHHLRFRMQTAKSGKRCQSNIQVTQQQQNSSKLPEAAVLYATIIKMPNLQKIDAYAGVHCCISHQVRSAWAVRVC